MRREPRRKEIRLKVGEHRFRPPRDVQEVVVEFGPAPLRLTFVRRIRAPKLQLEGKVLKPAVAAGATACGFYNIPPDATLAAGSNLARDVRNILGSLPPEGEQIDIGGIFAGKRVRARLRWVGTGVQSYAVLAEILGEAVS